MSSPEIMFIVIAVVFLVLAALTVPFLFQIWRTARNMAISLETLNQSLPGIMKNMEEITANVNKAAGTMNREVEDLARAIGHVRMMLGIGREGSCLRPEAEPLFRALRMVTAAVKGACVFFDVFRSRR
jgi:hypothetical protein